MSDRPDNPPAFPRSGYSGGVGPALAQDGMLMLDYLAGQALARLATPLGGMYSSPASDAQVAAEVARTCYLYAAAMLAERAKRTAPAEDLTQTPVTVQPKPGQASGTDASPSAS